MDMSGGGTIATMYAIGKPAETTVVAIIPATENMPGGVRRSRATSSKP